MYLCGTNVAFMQPTNRQESVKTQWTSPVPPPRSLNMRCQSLSVFFSAAPTSSAFKTGSSSRRPPVMSDLFESSPFPLLPADPSSSRLIMSASRERKDEGRDFAPSFRSVAWWKVLWWYSRGGVGWWTSESAHSSSFLLRLSCPISIPLHSERERPPSLPPLPPTLSRSHLLSCTSSSCRVGGQGTGQGKREHGTKMRNLGAVLERDRDRCLKSRVLNFFASNLIYLQKKSSGISMSREKYLICTFRLC